MTSATLQDRQIAGFAALAVVIHILEASVPSPLPGVKPGLANVITLIVLWRHGWVAAAWVAGLRVLVGSLLLGSFMTPTFMLSASGALASIVVLGLTSWVLGTRRPWSPSVYGYALLAAWAHMAAQLWMAWWLFIPHDGLWRLAPVLLMASTVFAAVTGWAAAKVLTWLAQQQERPC
jgi:heptaprenyl diphosphate synthase